MSEFHIELKRARLQKGLSREDLASKLQCDPRTIARWENNASRPNYQSIRYICEFFDKTQEELGLLDLNGNAPEGEGLSEKSEGEIEDEPARREQLEEVPGTADFCGRIEECAQLSSWITDERCQVVAILGMGGMGKTMLAARLVQLVAEDFSVLFWRSLKNTPPLADVLQKCLHFLSPQSAFAMPTTIDEQISLLIQYLRDQRCLLVLDNLETLFQPGEHVGIYRPGFEDYAQFIRRLGETTHKSCLLLTSREKPVELVELEGTNNRVRAKRLSGLSQAEGRELLKSRALDGEAEQWQALVKEYAGNPLALKLAASVIHDLFSDEIAFFLQQNEFIFSSIDGLLHQHFHRLTEQERELIYWLAIAREALSLDQLRANLLVAPPRGAVISALDSLSRRSLIETDQQRCFSLQPVILEYATNDLVARANKEFQALDLYPDQPLVPTSWKQFAFLQAQSSDYIRETQKLLILTPLAEQLVLNGRASLRQQLIKVLERQRANPLNSYLAANVLHLFLHLELDIQELDCSEQAIRQAYLQNVQLPGVTFSQARFQDTTFTNIFGVILSLAINASGTLLAAGTGNGEIWLYDVARGVPINTYEGHSDGVWALSFNPDGTRLASGSDDGTARIWNTTTGVTLHVFTAHTNRVRAVAFSPDGALLATGSNDRQIHLWDSTTYQLTRTLTGHKSWIWSLAWHPAGTHLASASTDHTLRLWDHTAATDPVVLAGHTDRIRAVAFHPTGDLLASVSDDQTLRVWSFQDHQCLHVLAGHTNRVWSVAFSRDGTTLATGSEDCSVALWDHANGKRLHQLPHHTHGVRSVTFGRDGLLASGADDQTIRIYDSTTGNSLKTFHGYPKRVWCLSLIPASGLLLSASEDQKVRLWDMQKGQTVKTIPLADQRVRASAVSTTAPLFASVGEEQVAHLWNYQTGTHVRQFQGHSNWVRAVALSPDGTRVATGSEDNTAAIWDVQSGRCLHVLTGHSNWVRAVAFGPGGTILATGSDDCTIRLWETASGHEQTLLEGHHNPIRALLFHPTRPLLFSGSEDHTITLWNTTTSHQQKKLTGHSAAILSLDLDPSGNWLASCSDDLSIRLWNIANDTVRTIPQAHTNRIRSVAYNLDGSLLASCSDDGTIKLWDLATLTCQRVLVNKLPYEDMNIIGATGLTKVQENSLRILGALGTN